MRPREGSFREAWDREVYGPSGKADAPPLAGRVRLAKGIEEGIEPPEELEPDVLLKGRVHSVYGGSGVGKTWLVVWEIKQCIERGETVAVFDAENGPRIISERLGALGVDTAHLDEKLHYYSFPNLTMNPEHIASYKTLLDEVKPALVIFDSLVNFLGSAGLEENSNDDIVKWAVNYTRPARERGITVLLLDHVPHENNHARGASRKKDEVDVMWALKNPMPFDRDTVGRVVLHREKDREGWLPERVGFSVGGTMDGFIFQRSEGTIEKPDATDGLTASERKVLDTLRDEFGAKGGRAAEWKKAAKARKVSEPTFWRALRKIKDRELVELRNERYFPAQGPDGGGDDSEEERKNTQDTANYHLLSQDYHDSSDSVAESTITTITPLRGDSSDSSDDQGGGQSASGAMPTDNGIQPPRATTAQKEAKEGKTSNTSSNPSLSSGSSAQSEAEIGHVVVVDDGRLTAEQVEEYKRRRALGESAEEARMAVLAKRQPRRVGLAN
jgi:hypothetical protein